MLNQFEDMLLNTLVQKLNSHGINVNADTIRTAVANSPQIVQQIESILLSSNSEDKLQQIKNLISQATQGTTSTTSTTNQTNTTVNK